MMDGWRLALGSRKKLDRLKEKHEKRLKEAIEAAEKEEEEATVLQEHLDEFKSLIAHLELHHAQQ